VLTEFELDVLPGLVEFSQGLLHFGFLFCLVSGLFHIFSVLGQVQVVDVAEGQLGVNDELHLDLVSEFLPVALSHGGVAQLSDQGEEDQPLFDFFEDAVVCVCFFVNLHFLEGLLQLFNLVFHFTTVGDLPLDCEVVLENLLAVRNVVPEASHVVDLDFDAINHLLGILNHAVAVVEFAADVAIVTDFGFKIVNFYENGVQLLGSILTAAVVLVEVTLLHLL